jgi:DNA-binding NarL/FixJ family response regulator
MRECRVLLVEDNSFTRSTVAASLEAEGLIVVDAVGSAWEALAAAQEFDIDCAVIDLHLGRGPSGIDVAHGLRQSQPRMGIVILTSYADPRLLSSDQRDLPYGASYVVKKDIESTSQLRSQVEAALDFDGARTPRRAYGISLTDTQVNLLKMVAEGLTNAEIARRRGTTDRSVEITLARIVKRLNLNPCPSENPRVLLAQAYFEMISGVDGP